MLTKDELLAKAQKPSQDAVRLHAFYRGKMQTLPKCGISSPRDFAVWYTPGVAAATAMKAQEQGIARMTRTREELIVGAAKMIRAARESASALMDRGLIPSAPARL